MKQYVLKPSVPQLKQIIQRKYQSFGKSFWNRLQKTVGFSVFAVVEMCT